MTLPSPLFETKNGLLVERQTGITVSFAHMKELEDVAFRLRDPRIGSEKRVTILGRIIFRTSSGEMTTDPDLGTRGIGFSIYSAERAIDEVLQLRGTEETEFRIFLEPGLKMIGAEEFGIGTEDVTIVFEIRASSRIGRT